MPVQANAALCVLPDREMNEDKHDKNDKAVQQARTKFTTNLVLSRFRKIACISSAVFLVLFLLLALCFSPDLSQTISDYAACCFPRDNILVQKDIDYCGTNDKIRQADFYRPATAGRPLPVVLVVHGGSWRTGSKNDLSEISLARDLCSNGYAAFVINYRMTSQGGFPKDIIDIKNACSYIVAKHQELYIDPSRIFVIGTSSGASSALLASYSQHAKIFPADSIYKSSSFSVRAVCSISGPTDFRPLAKNPYLQEYLHCQNEAEYEKILVAASPASYAASSEPTILVHGKQDINVPFKHSVLLARALGKKQTPCQLVQVEGSGHFIGSESRKLALKEVLAFFARHDPGL